MNYAYQASNIRKKGAYWNRPLPYTGVDGQVCPRCSIYRDPARFLEGRKSCLDCKAEMAFYHQRNKQTSQSRDRRRNYGLTQEEYDDYLVKQEGLCALCHKEETVIMRGHVKQLSVDHDHKTGQIRALLCARCNFLVGLAERYSDNEITQAREYLHLF